MKNNVKVSVIMSTYREQKEYLQIAIESILNQDFEEYEFLIAIDDPTNKELIAFINEYAEQNDKIRVFVNSKNLGLVSSLNKLLENATGEYIARMDADDYSYKCRLRKQYNYSVKNGLDIAAAYVKVVDESNRVIREMNKLPLSNNLIRRNLKYNNCLPHPVWFVKKTVYEELGGYNQVPYCEDYDFILRAREREYVFGNYNEVLLDYRMTRNSLSRSNLYKQYLSMKYILGKYEKKNITIPIEDYYKKYYDEKKEERYCRSAAMLSDGLISIKDRKYMNALVLILKSYFGSVEYQKKMWAYFLQELR